MKVKWTTFDHNGFETAWQTYPEADERDFIRIHVGTVVDRTTGLFGCLYYFVNENGKIRKVDAEDCEIMDEETY
jgi:hypothetical protein